MTLKPCPFCGHKEPEIVQYGTSRVSTQYECGMCSCNLETSETFNHGGEWNDRPFETAAKEFYDAVIQFGPDMHGTNCDIWGQLSDNYDHHCTCGYQELKEAREKFKTLLEVHE